MTTATLSMPVGTATHGTSGIRMAPTAVTSAGRAAHTVFIPREQLYYWTRRWQRDEQEAVQELAAGPARSFTSGAEAAAWLLSDDDE